MKKEAIKLSIENPCSEDWGKMTASEKGRFCDACQKVVVDFAAMSDKQIIDFLSNTSGKICGRIAKSQLNEPIYHTEYKPKFQFGKYLAGLFVALGFNNSGNALPFSWKSSYFQTDKKGTTNDLTQNRQIIIKGQVKSKGKALANVDVNLSGTAISCTTDKSGKYTLVIPEKYFNNEIYVIYSALNYETKEVLINIDKNSTYTQNVTLSKEEEQHIKGEIMIMGKIKAMPE
ncbi:MAG: carboxypeptidase-like regulatory domain-containing protein [Bacteroidia bacterium]